MGNIGNILNGPLRCLSYCGKSDKSAFVKTASFFQIFLNLASPRYLPIVVLACILINMIVMTFIYLRGAIFLEEKKKFEELKLLEK